MNIKMSKVNDPRFRFVHPKEADKSTDYVYADAGEFDGVKGERVFSGNNLVLMKVVEVKEVEEVKKEPEVAPIDERVEPHHAKIKKEVPLVRHKVKPTPKIHKPKKKR